MKLTLIFFSLCSFFIQVNAQTEKSLAVDENGKLIFYEVVTAQNLSKDLLVKRSTQYLQKETKEMKLRSSVGDSVFMASGKIIINKTLLVMSHPSGEVHYHFQVEIKEGKYRFWFTNFSFISYQRDRYGNFVPTTSLGAPLENDQDKLNTGQWKEYQAQAAKYVVAQAAKFKDVMAANVAVAVPVPEKKVVEKNWP